MKQDEFDAQLLEDQIVLQKIEHQIEKSKKKILTKMLKSNNSVQLSKYKEKLISLDKQLSELKNQCESSKVQIKSSPQVKNASLLRFIFEPTKCDNDFEDFVCNFIHAISNYNRLMKQKIDLEMESKKNNVLETVGTSKTNALIIKDRKTLKNNHFVDKNPDKNDNLPQLVDSYSAFGLISEKLPHQNSPLHEYEGVNANEGIETTIKSVADKDCNKNNASIKNKNPHFSKPDFNKISSIDRTPVSVYTMRCDSITNLESSGGHNKSLEESDDPHDKISDIDKGPSVSDFIGIKTRNSIISLQKLSNNDGKINDTNIESKSQNEIFPSQNLQNNDEKGNTVYIDISNFDTNIDSQEVMDNGQEQSKTYMMKNGDDNRVAKNPNITFKSSTMTKNIPIPVKNQKDKHLQGRLYLFKSKYMEDVVIHKTNNFSIQDSEIHNEIMNLYKYFMENSLSVGNFKIPAFIQYILFPYQQEAVSWMYNLFLKNRGCLLADEMGLGKTLQVIALLSGLYCSRLLTHSIIITPSTILKQWVTEFKKYFPFIRIILLHKSHTDSISKTYTEIKRFPSVVLISYDGFKLYKSILANIKFTVVILDEGHKIKNKNSDISQAIAQIVCKFKVVLTGTPIQNNLQELWAIFNFLNKGLLGTFDEFVAEFEDPIKKGGFACASEDTVIKAYKKSRMLRSLIQPYFLRRLKSEVALQLPDKMDKVVFCKLTPIQEKYYKDFCESDYISRIIAGKGNCLSGIVALRKICNHPYLRHKDPNLLENLLDSCGKLQKTHDLLLKWKEDRRKVLIFTQLLEMLEIFEIYFKRNGFSYLKMEGKSSLKLRETNIENFNADPNIFIFLMTTRVGGLGLNLVGASRVILYDPDWNPSNDSQAKERAWRYGQELDVKIYRMISAGTIEEKIYQRQVFKSMLSRKILVDPKLSKFFEKDDITDLFSYDEYVSERTENMNISANSPPELEFINKDLPPEIKEKFEAFKSKDKLTDQEMIDYILLRESN